MIAFLGIYLAIALLLASPALFRKQTRGWVIVLMIVVLGDLIALFAGSSYQHAHYQNVVFAGADSTGRRNTF